ANDNAVDESCWRVCKASRLAPSSLVSARVRLSAPVLSVLIIDLVKSWRICTVDRFEPKDCACERRVESAAVRLAWAVVISELAAQLPAETRMPKPAASSVTPFTVTLDWLGGACSLRTTVRSSPPSRLMPLKPESP